MCVGQNVSKVVHWERVLLMSLNMSRFFQRASAMNSASTSLEYSVDHLKKVWSESVTA